jgi:outer membrane protein assembly factor BamD (BamD/ComL family)
MTASRFLSLSAAALAVLVALAWPQPAASQGGSGDGPAASLLAAAERRGRDGDVAGALEDYAQLVRQFPESSQAPEAMLRMAHGRLSLGDREGALDAIEQLVTSYPRKPQAAGGLLLEGRIRSRQPSQIGDLEGARKALEKVWLLFPGGGYPQLPARSAARVLDGQIALRLQEELEATTSFLEVIEREPRSPWTADAYVGLAAAFARGGEWRAAAESLQDALGVDGASEATVALTRRWLSLLDRRLLRPASGERLWTAARQMSVAGAQPKRLSAVAADDEGRLLLLDTGSDQLLSVDADGRLENRWAVRNGERPSWSRDGAVQMAARDSVILPGETKLQFRTPGREKDLDGIRAVERGPWGRWIVLASRANGVLSFSPDRGSGRPVVGGDGDPVDLTADRRDRLYILERKGKRVLRISQHDDSRDTVASGAWKQAAAVAVDALGFVHVLDAGNGRIHSYDPSGTEVATVGPALPGGIELRRAEDLAVSGDGRLFIVDSRAGLVVLE